MQRRNRESGRLLHIGYLSLLHVAFSGYLVLDGVATVVRHVKPLEFQPFFVAVAVIMGVFGVTMSKASFVRSRLVRERIGPDPNPFTVRVFRILTVVLTVDVVVLACLYVLMIPGAGLTGHIVPYVDHGTLYLVSVPGANAFYFGFSFAAAAVYVSLAIFVFGMAWVNRSRA